MAGPTGYSVKFPATEDQPCFNVLLPGYQFTDLRKIILTMRPYENKPYDFLVEIDIKDGGVTWENTDLDGNPTDILRHVTKEQIDNSDQKVTLEDLVIQILQGGGSDSAAAPFLSIGDDSLVTFPPRQAKFGAAYDHVEIIYNDSADTQASAEVTYINDQAAGDKKVVNTETITGALHKMGTYTPDVPAGYQLVPNQNFDYTLTNDDTDNLTVHIVPKPTPVVPSGPSDNPVPAKQESSTTPTVSAPSKQPTVTEQPDVPNYAAVKDAAVYATKGIYLYKTANFKNSQRIAKYPKVKRVNRPMFVVVNYARSTNGVLRYKVRDVNHGSKTAGKVGYITANRKYVVPVYYQTMPKNNRITVINKKGVNAYKQVNLTHKITNYKKGTRLTVKKVVKHNLTTRYQLANGNYITGNKKLVIQGNY